MLGDLTGFWRHLTVNTTLKPTNSSTRFALISHHLNVMFQRNLKTQHLIRHCQTEVNQSVGLPAAQPLSVHQSFPAVFFFFFFSRCKTGLATHTQTGRLLLLSLPLSLSTNKEINVSRANRPPTPVRPSLLPHIWRHSADPQRGSGNTWERQRIQGHNANRVFVLETLFCQVGKGRTPFTIFVLHQPLSGRR